MFVLNSLRFRVLPNDEVLDGLWIKTLGGIVIDESPVEIVCRRLLGCDTMRANEVVTSNDETEASRSALESCVVSSIRFRSETESRTMR